MQRIKPVYIVCDVYQKDNVALDINSKVGNNTRSKKLEVEELNHSASASSSKYCNGYAIEKDGCLR